MSYTKRIISKGKMKKKIILLILIVITLISIVTIDLEFSKHNNSEMRGVWISTVFNLDWPNANSNVEKQKNDLVKYYDDIKDINMNAVFMQVRSMGDAMYSSEYSPWSSYFTGELGKDPGYDPLEFAIDEAKKRKLEFHAWFNPFRISTSNNFSLESYFEKLDNKNVLKNKPEYFVKYGNETWLNPGIPEVRQYAIDVILEVVKNYDIDGVHLDDYFYPYPKENIQYNDEESFKKYNSKNLSLEDWRRENLNLFIKELNRKIKLYDKDIRFGVSPFGIWKNKDDSEGSNTNGLSSYYELYADSKKWVEEEWIDYICPQLYWKMDSKNANYKELVNWWGNVVKDTSVDLYIGQAAYRTEEEKPWDESELVNQIRYNREKEEVSGSIFFRLKNIIKENEELNKVLKKDLYGGYGTKK